MCRFFKYIFVLVLAGLNSIQILNAQQLAVKSNVLYLGAGIPNVGMELVTGNRSSLEISFLGAYKPYTFDFKILGIQPEFRYWIAGRPLVREYIGISATATTYDIGTSKKTYKGDAIGLGISLGYVLPISKRWDIEFSAGFGGYYYRHIQHNKNDNLADELSKSVNAKGVKLLPTKLGVSFTYIIK